ncbi:hypothetical protein OGAPHI_006013 [Ogataea philodendri]|uniref:Uncharacterized protein n=1 Tax=Ogataea philodendri TaxID=1378263 RepID=A0A9P8T1D6_9ASCO|nr:uncharacterized protein OGAPHI_006013 [Ogataea philodendri]KAH3661835.1 hypothetical protein OGAPHI_006013 [Ogataea philodendri]
MSNKGKVQTWVTCNQGGWSQVGGLQWSLRTVLWLQLVQQNGVVLTVAHVAAEIGHSSVPVGCFEMIVEPSEQNLFRRKSQELFQSLVILQQSVQFWMELDIDLAQQTSSDNLPNQTQNQVFFSFNNIFRMDVDNHTSNGLGRVQHHVGILQHREVVQLLALLRDVQNSGVNCVWNRIVNQLGKNQSVCALVENLERIERKWQSVTNMGIASENGIDVSGELNPLFVVDCVCGTGLSCDNDLGSSTGSLVYKPARRRARRGHRAGRGSRTTRNRRLPDLLQLGMQLNIVVQLHMSRSINTHLLQCLSHVVVRTFALLRHRLDHMLTVHPSFIVQVDLAEIIDNVEDIFLFPTACPKTSSESPAWLPRDCPCPQIPSPSRIPRSLTPKALIPANPGPSETADSSGTPCSAATASASLQPVAPR